MELVKDGSLEKIIKERRSLNGFSDEEASILMKNILEAVNYLHNNNVVHRDLKPGTN